MAREIAEKWRPLVASGIDPIERRKEQRVAERVEAAKAMTFDDCRTAYIAAHEASWRNPKHRQQMGKHAQDLRNSGFRKAPGASGGHVVRSTRHTASAASWGQRRYPCARWQPKSP